MIKTLTPTIFLGNAPVTPATESPIDRSLPGPVPMAREIPRSERLEVLAGVLELVWRYVRRMGFSEGAADDVAQEAFCIAASRVDVIEIGKERAYLLSTAIHLAEDRGDYPGKLKVNNGAVVMVDGTRAWASWRELADVIGAAVRGA